ncbi:hypothetical protein [Williamsia sp. 1135]|uniref:hypothetical protein n=1 Tax=Williamsia sp. 1135 TaxID=1889262 RepID=UPI000A112706|nr:hypothetical protein [Williamsia sp. 1135]ORM25195.1 hypothetical protein BFL43_26110 [Williamsia sp. 1135]
MGDRSASKPERIDTRQRAAEAVRLRAEGLSYQAIADQLGFTTENAANKAVLGVLRRTEVERAGTLRTLEVQRLDMLWLKTIRGITRSETSQQGLSAALVTAAVRVSERRARLLGLDAPTQIEEVSPVDLGAAMAEFQHLLDIAYPTAPPKPRPEDIPR